MPQYSSRYRNNIIRERILDGASLRTIEVSLNDYGTISATDYVANADLFKRAYSDAVNRTFDSNVIFTINVPAGDYFFAGINDINQWQILQAPQWGQIRIVGAPLVGSRPSSVTLSNQNREQNYASLAGYHATRFHFDYNGFYILGDTGGTYTGSGFANIGFFGARQLAGGVLSYKSDSSSRRGIGGRFKIEYCSFHGWMNGINSIGIQPRECNGYSICTCDCTRGLQVAYGASYTSFGIDTTADRDMFINSNGDHGVLAQQGQVRLSPGSHIRNSATVGILSREGSFVNAIDAVVSGSGTANTQTLDGGAIKLSA